MMILFLRSACMMMVVAMTGMALTFTAVWVALIKASDNVEKRRAGISVQRFWTLEVLSWACYIIKMRNI